MCPMYKKTEGNDNLGLPIQVVVCLGAKGSWPTWINVLAKSRGCPPTVTPKKLLNWRIKSKWCCDLTRFSVHFFIVTYQVSKQFVAKNLAILPWFCHRKTNRSILLPCLSCTLQNVFKIQKLSIFLFVLVTTKRQVKLTVIVNKSWK